MGKAGAAPDVVKRIPNEVRLGTTPHTHHLTERGLLSACRSVSCPELNEQAQVALALLPDEEAELLRHHFGFDEEEVGLFTGATTAQAKELFADPDWVRNQLHELALRIAIGPTEPLAAAG